MRRDVLRAIVAWLRVHDRSGTQVADTRLSYPTRVAERSAVGPIASTLPQAVPTINSWPEHERRGYDAYVRELAYLEHVLAEERKGRYGRQADEDEDDEDVRCLREETCTRCGQPESEHGGQEGWCRSEDEDKPWSTRHRFEQRWDESHDADDVIVSDLDEQRRRAWEQEVDELYEREELERLAAREEEKRNDR